jgi:hypothetical protein
MVFYVFLRMSYLSNGSTLRATFRNMEPMRHHLDPSQSEVISHIRRTLDYSEEAAERAFNSMRNPKSGVLLFDRVPRLWYGCDWTPDEEDAKKDFFTQRFSEMKREVAALREEVREFSEMKKKIYKELDSIWETIETGKNGQQSDSTNEDQAARERQQDAAKMQKMWQA